MCERHIQFSIWSTTFPKIHLLELVWWLCLLFWLKALEMQMLKLTRSPGFKENVKERRITAADVANVHYIPQPSKIVWQFIFHTNAFVTTDQSRISFQARVLPPHWNSSTLTNVPTKCKYGLIWLRISALCCYLVGHIGEKNKITNSTRNGLWKHSLA